MKVAFHNRWLSLIIVFLEPLLPLRRYRVLPQALESPTRRWLRRQIIRRMREPDRDLL